MLDSTTFAQKLILAWPPELWRDVTVVVAVSGGPDSVALLRGLTAAAGPGQGHLTVAHFNHGLRGEQSQADEAFVADLCHALGVECTVGRAGKVAAATAANGEREQRAALENIVREADEENDQGTGRSCEADLRAARYQFLGDTARQVGARYVVTGHTADDQAETVLHRIVRGTGIAGLAGMRRHRQLIPGVSLVRPLLNVSRREVLEYLAAIGQVYREDHTNAELRFTRNRIRHELMPYLSANYNAGVVDAITRLASLAGEAQEVVAGLADNLADRSIAAERPGEATVDCDVLASAPRFLVRELLIAVWRRQGWALQAMGFERWEELAELALARQLPADVWKKVFPGSVSAARDGRVLRLLALPAPARAPKSFS